MDLQPMRLLLIGPLPPPLGGTTVMFEQLVHELGSHSDVQVDVINTSRGRHSGRIADLFAALRVLVQLPSRIAQNDVVTFHASPPGTALFGPIVALLCRVLRRPLLIREYGGSLDVEYESLGPIARCLVRQLFASAWVLFETRSLVEHFTRLFPGSRCHWYANCRPLPATAPPPRTDSSGARRFVFVGHVKATKGVGELLEAARRLETTDLHIDVYGPLLDGFPASAFDGQERVTYRGVLPTSEVSSRIRDYDALLLPTHHPGEGYPGVILEAYAQGLPVVTTRWRSIPEIVEHGKSGLLIQPRDAAALARAIEALHADAELLKSLREGALARAQEFSLQHWTREFVRICREARAGG